MKRPMRTMRAFQVFAVLLLAIPSLVVSSEPSSAQFRLIGSGPASVAATAASPLYQAQLAGGSGAPVGISASANTSVVAGPTSQELPTARIFRDNFGD